MTQHLANMNSGYIYVLITREFINSKQRIYKIGRTNQNPPWKRFKQYPIGSQVILLRMVNDSINMEKQIKHKLKTLKEIKHRIDIGEEYFEGDINHIISISNNLCQGGNPVIRSSDLMFAI